MMSIFVVMQEHKSGSNFWLGSKEGEGRQHDNKAHHPFPYGATPAIRNAYVWERDKYKNSVAGHSTLDVCHHPSLSLKLHSDYEARTSIR